MTEAAEGQSQTLWDQVVLLCRVRSEATGEYVISPMGHALVGALTVVVLATGIAVLVVTNKLRDTRAVIRKATQFQLCSTPRAGTKPISLLYCCTNCCSTGIRQGAVDLMAFFNAHRDPRRRESPGGEVLVPRVGIDFRRFDRRGLQLHLWVSAIFFIPIVGMVIGFGIKYRRSKVGEVAEVSPSHNTALELSWSVTPAILMAIMFLGLQGLPEQTRRARRRRTDLRHRVPVGLELRLRRRLQHQ